MSRFRVLAARLRGTVRRTALDDQLDDEIRAHLEMQADEYVREGLTPGEARLAALRRFGGVDRSSASAARPTCSTAPCS